MKLFHGTNEPNPIIAGKMINGTWLAGHLFHGYRIAERRATQRGGSPIVVEIETDSVSRVEGRDNPTYQYSGGSYIPVAVHSMLRTEILD